MRTKEEYYDQVLENRKLAADPEITKCTCPNPLCDWHGKCIECVALHRYHNDHIPFCLQSIISDKVKMLSGVVEMVTVKKEPTPLVDPEYQGKGIGKELLRRIINKYCDYLRVVLIADEEEAGFYQNSGFEIANGTKAMFINRFKPV